MILGYALLLGMKRRRTGVSEGLEGMKQQRLVYMTIAIEVAMVASYTGIGLYLTQYKLQLEE